MSMSNAQQVIGKYETKQWHKAWIINSNTQKKNDNNKKC